MTYVSTETVACLDVCLCWIQWKVIELYFDIFYGYKEDWYAGLVEIF